MNKKSVFELISDSFATFKESFWGICATYIVAFILLVIAAVILPKSLITSAQQKGLSADKIIFSAISYLVILIWMGWQIIIIKNNIFTGQSQLLESFKKALTKTPQILITVVPLFIIVTIVLYPVALIPYCGRKFLFPLAEILISPFIIMLPLSVVLQDAPLKISLANSFGLTLIHYFRILLRIFALGILYLLIMIPFVIAVFIFGLTILVGPTMLFMAIIGLLLYVCMQIFSSCYLVELYIDLATENKPVDVEEELLVETPAEDINQPFPQQAQPQQQIPGEQTVQPTQQIIQEQPPEGLRPLGGDYKDNNQQ